LVASAKSEQPANGHAYRWSTILSAEKMKSRR
jgi:hypothetical protein